MKKLLIFCSVVLCGCSAVLFADTVSISRGGYGGSPTEILDAVVAEANEDYEIQETKLDRITSTEKMIAGPQYRITNTLAYVKDSIHPYMQWILYFGLAIATILIIYNGFLMVTNATHGSGEFSKVKGNFINIAIGVIILTGFYYLIDIIIAVINFLFD